MKNVQELYNEVMANPELKASFIEAAKAGKQEAFLKEHSCNATVEEVAAFLKAQAEDDSPLSMDELENSAGGKCNEQTGGEVALSVFTAGLGCAIATTVSGGLANENETHHVGQRNKTEGRLCNRN